MLVGSTGKQMPRVRCALGAMLTKERGERAEKGRASLQSVGRSATCERRGGGKER